MNNKVHSSFFVLTGLIFCVVYILVAVKPLGKEIQFVPEWKIDVTNPSIAKDAESEAMLPFKLGQTLGYFTPEGEVTNFITFPQKAFISDSAYTFYNINNTAASIFNPDGTLKTKINAAGFPMIDEDRIFNFLPGGAAFSKYNEEGKAEWTYSGAVPLTAFDSSEKSIAAGFADGTICQFDMNGNLVQRFAPGGSEIPVILGIAVSSNGQYIAAICGQNRQRFVLAKKDGVHTKIISHEFLDSKETRQTLLKFSRDDSTVYYNSGKILGIENVKTGKIKHIKIEGQAISIQETDKYTFVLTKDGDKYSVYTIEPFATYIGKFSFKANSSFIKTYKNCLFVGKDHSISCIKIK